MSSISGRVSDPDDKPIAEARVCVVDLSVIHSAGRCVVTDAQGHYALDGLSAGSYLVTAARAGFVAGSAEQGRPVAVVAAARRTGVDIVLQPGGARVAGVVVDATGGPIPHAAVRGDREAPPRAVVDVEADDLGRFTLWLPPGFVIVTAESPAYASASWNGIAPSADVRLALTPGATIRGLVVSAVDGAPVPNAEVRASATRNPWSSKSRSTLSGDDGTFAIRGLEPGPYSLVAEADGLHGELRQPIELGLAATVENIRVELGAAAQVTGRVLLERTLKPCEEGFLALGPPDPRQPPPEGEESTVPKAPPGATHIAKIEADGVVHFAALQRGRYFVSVHCSGHILREGPLVLDVEGKALSDLTWKVGRGLGLTVLAVDDRDRPVPNVDFLVRIPRLRDSTPSMNMVGVTGADGRFEVPTDLLPGTYEVVASLPFEAEPVRAELREGGDPVTLRLKIAGSASIKVAVKTRKGEPLDGLAVSAIVLSAALAETAAPSAGPLPQRQSVFQAKALGNGEYRIVPLKPGRYEVRVDDANNPTVQTSVTVAAGEAAEASLQIDRGGHIRGHVLGEDGVPLPEVWVTAHAVNSHRDGPPPFIPPESEARVLTDADGRFVLDRLAGGDTTYLLRAEPPGGGAGIKDGVGVGEADVVLQVPAVGSIAGTVVGDCGDPSVPVTVRAMSEGTREVSSQELAAAGPFRLVVVPGHVQLVAVCQGGRATAMTTIDLSPKEDITGLRLALQAAPDVPAPFEGSAIQRN
jgi:uncharacterized GH25 family protein